MPAPGLESIHSSNQQVAFINNSFYLHCVDPYANELKDGWATAVPQEKLNQDEDSTGEWLGSARMLEQAEHGTAKGRANMNS